MGFASDKFNRADGSLGSNWTTISSASALAIVSNTVQAGSTAQHCAALWNAGSFADFQYAEITIGALPTNPDAIGLILRANAGVDRYYLFFVTSIDFRIYERYDGAYTLLNNTGFAATPGPGDVIRFEASSGSPVQLTGFLNGIPVVAANSAHTLSSGAPGIQIFDSGHSYALDNFRGGNWIDFYDYLNKNADAVLTNDTDTGGPAGGLGTSFTGNGQRISEVVWYLRKNTTLTGNITCKIWTMTGTYGVNGLSGTLLATADTKAADSLPTTYDETAFTFSGAERFVTTNGAHYVATIEYGSGNESIPKHINLGYDSSGTHPATWQYHAQATAGVWTAIDAGIDLVFYIQTDGGVEVSLTGVAASPAIGTGAAAVTAPLSGVAASPAIGTGAIAVSTALTGVSASPAIGTGTVDTGAVIEPPPVTVDVGGGGGLIGRLVKKGQRIRRSVKRKRIVPIPCMVEGRGVMAFSATGRGVFSSEYLIAGCPDPVASVSTVTTEIGFELFEEEIMALLATIK